MRVQAPRQGTAETILEDEAATVVSHPTAASQLTATAWLAHRYDACMTADYYALQVLLLAFSGWVNRKQQRTIEYLVEEN